MYIIFIYIYIYKFFLCIKKQNESLNGGILRLSGQKMTEVTLSIPFRFHPGVECSWFPFPNGCDNTEFIKQDLQPYCTSLPCTSAESLSSSGGLGVGES